MVLSTSRATAGGRRSGCSSPPWCTMVNFRLFPLLLVLSLGSTSCWFRKPPRAFVPPPAQPKPVIVATPPEVPAAPEIDADATATLPPDLPSSMPSAPPPPAAPSAPSRHCCRAQNRSTTGASARAAASAQAGADFYGRAVARVQPGFRSEFGTGEKGAGDCGGKKFECGSERDREPHPDLPETS